MTTNACFIKPNEYDHPRMSRFDSYHELSDEQLREVAGRKLESQELGREAPWVRLATIRLGADLELRMRLILGRSPRIIASMYQRRSGAGGWQRSRRPVNDIMIWADRLDDMVAVLKLAQMIVEVAGLPTLQPLRLIREGA